MYRISIVNGGPLAEGLREEFPDVDVYESVSATRAVELACQLSEAKQTDAIICVTGIAELMRSVASIPIIVRDPSDFDIMEVLSKADGALPDDSDHSIALILHKSWEVDVRRFQPYLKHRLQHYRYESDAAIVTLVNRLACEGTAAMVGGPTVLSAAQAQGIPAFFLYTGTSSLRLAVRQTHDMLEYTQNINRQNLRMEKVLDMSPDVTLTVDGDGLVLNGNEKACRLFHLSPAELQGKPIKQIFAGVPAVDYLLQRERCKNQLLELDGRSWFFSLDSFSVDGTPQGAVITLRSAEEIERMEHKYRRDRSSGMVAKFNFSEIRTQNPDMASIKEIAQAFAVTDSTVLILGETGSGKELFAHSIHNSSLRRRGPFVAVNCAALPENLIESELMGYDEGAFTNARRGGKAGFFELAHTGTIFLDEISQIPIHMQGGILRVLQEKQVFRLGGSHITPVDVRIVAATNEDLLALVRQGRMRQDLYYRLNVLQLKIPALRERPEDIRSLIDHYFQLFCQQYGQAVPFSERALTLLERYDWPGNVRELINCVERYVIISRQLGNSDLSYVQGYLASEQADLTLSEELLQDPASEPSSLHVSAPAPAPAPAPEPPAEAPTKAAVSASPDGSVRVVLGSLAEMEQQIIAATLEHCRGSKQKAAALLGISRPTLWKKYDQSLTAVAHSEGESVFVVLSSLDSMEAQLIQATLEQFRGSKNQAADALGISRTTLWKRMQTAGV